MLFFHYKQVVWSSSGTPEYLRDGGPFQADDGELIVRFSIEYGRGYNASVFDRATGDLLSAMGGSTAAGERATHLMALREAMRLYGYVKRADRHG